MCTVRVTTTKSSLMLLHVSGIGEYAGVSGEDFRVQEIL